MVILDLLESESNRRDDRDKYNRVDLLAKAHDDERIIVEVQYLSEMPYLRRLTYGDDYIYHGKTEFTGLHTYHPVTLKKSLVGGSIQIRTTRSRMGLPPQYRGLERKIRLPEDG